MSEREDTRPVAVVLGALVHAGGVPSPALRAQASTAAALWDAGRVRAIIGCGAQRRHAPSEARAIVDICVASGVPADRCLIEDRSTNTLENLAFARPLLERLGATGVVVVSDAYHLPRALLFARRLGLRARAVATPITWPRTRGQLHGLLRETAALVWALASGQGRGM